MPHSSTRTQAPDVIDFIILVHVDVHLPIRILLYTWLITKSRKKILKMTFPQKFKGPLREWS